MTSIGDRLEEARKRQGISLREAAEATKVRTDFLSNFEKDEFEFDLPEVYKRGFLKLYARYLKVDVDKLMTDYSAVVLGNMKSQRREKGENFGRIDLPESTKAIGGANTNPPFGERQATSTNTVTANVQHSGPTHSSYQGGPADSMETETDTTLYWKIGLVFAGFFVTAGIVYLLISALTGRSPDEVQDSQAAGEVVTATTRTIRIQSSEPAHVVVRQEDDNKILFRGTTQPGQEITLEGQGPIRIVSTEFQNISVEVDGRTFRSNQSGLGQHIF